MASFRDEVERIVEERLEELGADVSPLSAGELAARYGRRDLDDGARHYAVEIDGTRYALTVTPLEQAQVDDHRPIAAVTDEVERLQREQRVVPYHQVIVAPAGTVLLDLVPDQDRPEPEEDGSGMAFLQRLLDHDAVRPLMR